MDIYINQAKTRKPEFHLQNKNISYIIGVLPNQHLGSLYFGNKLQNNTSFSHLQQQAHGHVPITPELMADVPGFSLDLARAEYPSFGQGDYRTPAIILKQENGSTLSDFKYVDYQIIDGKPTMEGLPQTYVDTDDEAKTLQVILKDPVINAQLILSYTIFRDFPVITRQAQLINQSTQTLQIQKLASASFDLPSEAAMGYKAFYFSGNWSREMQYVAKKLEHEKISIASNRGTSSAIHQPFIGLQKGIVTEDMGEVYGLSLIYSGNHECSAEIDQYGNVRTSLGINPFNFSWQLKPQQKFQSPEAVMVYSNSGLSGMSHTFHELYRNRLARGKFRNAERPILLNNWEATYFDFNEEQIVEIARKGKELGIELFVLDDGWFGNRNNDHTGLGDWFDNFEKLPSGIKGVADKIVGMGLQFGLWFEPEMVNKDSELYRKHPDWILEVPDRPNSPSRNQHTLDLSRADVCDYIYQCVAGHLESAQISYIKWDMNRPMTEVMSHGLSADHQGELAHRYMLGLYGILEKLTTNFPNVLFESCASGGNRFDGGMLYYMPQAWASDNTDAISRLSIQHGASMIYPISAIGSHVSATPNHQTGRTTDIKTRADVAYFGAFGYELDLNQLSEKEQNEVAEQIAFYKQYRGIIQHGTFHRLLAPYEGNAAAWMCVNADQTIAVVAHYRIKLRPNYGFERLKLKGLDPNRDYIIESTAALSHQTALGDELMQSGLLFDHHLFHDALYTSEIGDYKSRIVVLKAEQ